MTIKTVNPLFDTPAAPPAQVAASEPTSVETAANGIRPNALNSTNRCPVDGKPMRRAVCGVKGTDTEVESYVCLDHRVCLPVPNSEL